MNQIIKKIFKPDIRDNDRVKEWKLNAFYRTITVGVLPTTIPLLICFAILENWSLFTMVFTLFLIMCFSSYLARKKLLGFSINTFIFGTTVSTFFFLLSLRNTDSLCYSVFIIIIAGVFINAKASFIWATIHTIIMLVIAGTMDEFDIFPNIGSYLVGKHNTEAGNIFFSSFIFLYLVSAFLSILFQRYFTDLLNELNQANIGLEEQVESRTSQLTETNMQLEKSLQREKGLKEEVALRAQEEKEKLESELFQAQKLESIGLLSGGIAHNFNNRLGSVTSSANIILKKFSKENPDLGKYAKNIIQTCRTVGESTGKLLAFARKGKSELTKINMHQIVESVIQMLSVTLESNINIQTDFKAKRADIKGDYTEMQNVIMNLAVNSRDAMPDGGKLIFSTQSIEIDKKFTKARIHNLSHGPHISLIVSDTGIGMNEETKSRIFEPFYTTKEPGKGTGLGLASVYGTIKNHNGMVDVSSEIGKGTTFKVFIPLLTTRNSERDIGRGDN